MHQRYRDSSGSIVPSVTTIIGNNLGWNKQVLINWAKNMASQGIDPEAVKKEAADTGTLAHKMIEEFIIDQCPHLSLDEGDRLKLGEFTEEQIGKAKNGLEAFVSWVNQNNPAFGDQRTQTEIGMVSDSLKYGGTIDFLVVLDGKLCLLDFKTSNGVYTDHRIQLSAYQWMVRENLGEDVPAHLLQIGKEDATFHHYFFPDLSQEFNVFLHLLELHKLRSSVDKNFL